MHAYIIHNYPCTSNTTHIIFYTNLEKQEHFHFRLSKSSIISKMASRDQQYRAGQAKGQAEEKTNQMLGNVKDKAQQSKDQTSDTMGSAWDKTKESKDQTGSYMSDKAGQAKDKASQMGQATKDKASDMARSTKETAEAGKDETGGMMQRTGETVKNMAAGATEVVKNTLGMGGNEETGHTATGGTTGVGRDTKTTTTTRRTNV